MSLRDRVTGQVRRRLAARARILPRHRRLDGSTAGHRDTEDPALFRPLVFGDPARLHVHPTAVVNNALFNLSSGEITVGEYAFFGHNVSVLTGTHDWTTFGAERQVAVPPSGRDVVVEDGAWVSSSAIIVAPCRIGAHSVVGVGSLVLGDVEPYTVVAGNPAKMLRRIPRPDEPGDHEEDQEPGPSESPDGGGTDGWGPRFAAIYADFTDRFRGSTTEIRTKLEGYLPDVHRLVDAGGVVDLGAGRGEWLTLLQDAGVRASGVDTNPAFVAAGRARGLDLGLGDALGHLRGLPPGSVDLISAFHVIEHLPTEDLLALLEAARTVLRPGGCLLLETPNPANLVMAACDFYNDPTHRSPMPAALTEYLVSSQGFVDIEVRPLHPKPSPLAVRDGDDAVAQLQELVEQVLFGPQDYAVLGYAPPAAIA